MIAGRVERASRLSVKLGRSALAAVRLSKRVRIALFLAAVAAVVLTLSPQDVLGPWGRGPEVTPGPTSGEGASCPTGELGVLVVYLDPGIDHDRAIAILDAAREVGAGWIRVGLIWGLANPAVDAYDFEEYDWIFERARERGIRVLAVVMYTPRWASSNPQSEEYYLFPPTDRVVGGARSPLGTSGTGYDYLYEFARIASSRYRGVIDRWELWNEPDMLDSLRDADGDGTSSDEYARMLAYFYRGIKDGNPEAAVLLGGLAYSPEEPGCDPDYLEEVLSDSEYPASENFDVLNLHLNFRDPGEFPELVEGALETLGQFGADDREVWITELSYSPIERFQILPSYRGGEPAFERYVREALKAGLEAGAQVVFWAPLYDYPPEKPEDFPYKYSGLYTYDLRLKGAGEVYREFARELQSSPP